MKDIIYIIKNSFISFAIVLFAFIIDLSNYYKINYMTSARRIFTGDIYTFTYFMMLVLFVIVVFELWKTVMEAYLEYRFYMMMGWIILFFVVDFLPIISLFQLILKNFIIVVVIQLAYQLYLKKKK